MYVNYLLYYWQNIWNEIILRENKLFFYYYFLFLLLTKNCKHIGIIYIYIIYAYRRCDSLYYKPLCQ